jgi:bifunctional non-homologous end joining protein LigD
LETKIFRLFVSPLAARAFLAHLAEAPVSDSLGLASSCGRPANLNTPTNLDEQSRCQKSSRPFSVCGLRLLWDSGRDLTGKSVVDRRKRLQEIITPVAGIQVGGYLEKRGIELFQLAKEKGFEGIIAKRKTSVYRPGKRSPDWLKIKSRPQQEFIVCGFTEGKGSRSKHFGALLLGAYRDGRLSYFGHSGSGFSEQGLNETIKRLQPLFVDKSAVENPPNIPERIQWIRPKLVCEVAFAEWTLDGELRRTTFLGWRDDKDPEEVVL